MIRKSIFSVLAMLLLLGMVLIPAQLIPALAEEPVTQSGGMATASVAFSLDGTWVILDQDMTAPAFFTGGPWEWNSPSWVRFTITDLFVVSDQFNVYDNTILRLTTPAMPDWDDLGIADPFTSPPWTDDPNVALADGRFSSGVIYFPPGAHSITIEDIHIPPMTAGGDPYPDGTVAFKAEAIVPSITPSLVDEIIFPGSSVMIEKQVQTPMIPAKPDIYFLADTTGSMGGAIDNVKANAATIMASILAAQPDAQFGVGNYKDFPYDAYQYQHQQDITSDTTLVENAINAWVAGGGADMPECQLYAMDRIATNGVGWRTGSTPIVVWFGDSPGHDPVPMVATGLGYDVTEDTTIAALVAAGIKVVAVDLCCLDYDPTYLGGDYAFAYGITEDGRANQATDIAAATSGVHLMAPTPDEVVAKILEGLTSLPVTVEMTSDCLGPISCTFTPASVTVTSGSIATFVETISVDSTAPGGKYECDDWALIDGVPMTDAAGVIIKEHKIIRVPEGFLTGGGQINTGKGKGEYKISFAGNVGFLADFSLVGQWETNFHNIRVDALDNARFHSTSITSLQFTNDGGAGPQPPPANANIASFSAIGRLNGEDGWTIAVRLADRGEPGKNDTIRIALTNPGGVVVYDSYTSGDFPSGDGAPTWTMKNLASGNLQIHSGVKD